MMGRVKYLWAWRLSSCRRVSAGLLSGLGPRRFGGWPSIWWGSHQQLYQSIDDRCRGRLGNGGSIWNFRQAPISARTSVHLMLGAAQALQEAQAQGERRFRFVRAGPGGVGTAVCGDIAAAASRRKGRHGVQQRLGLRGARIGCRTKTQEADRNGHAAKWMAAAHEPGQSWKTKKRTRKQDAAAGRARNKSARGRCRLHGILDEHDGMPERRRRCRPRSKPGEANARPALDRAAVLRPGATGRWKVE